MWCGSWNGSVDRTCRSLSMEVQGGSCFATAVAPAKTQVFANFLEK
jgi:hypothetical protein